MKNKAQELMTETVEKIISKMESGDMAKWAKQWVYGLPTNYSSKTQYSGFNLVNLIATAQDKGYKTNNWITYTQLKKCMNGAGEIGQLKEGSKATPIFFFKMLDIKEANKDGLEKNKKVPLLKFFYVFNLDQTNLDTPKGNDNANNLTVDQFIENTGAVIKEASEAFYAPSSDYIGMPKLELFTSSEAYYSTLLHELSHYTGGCTNGGDRRLDRDLSGGFGSDSYAIEELRAELSAAMLCSFFGIEGEMRHAEYLQSWIKCLKADPKILWKVGADAQKIFNYLFELQEKEEEAA